MALFPKEFPVKLLSFPVTPQAAPPNFSLPQLLFPRGSLWKMGQTLRGPEKQLLPSLSISRKATAPLLPAVSVPSNSLSPPRPALPPCQALESYSSFKTHKQIHLPQSLSGISGRIVCVAPACLPLFGEHAGPPVMFDSSCGWTITHQTPLSSKFSQTGSSGVGCNSLSAVGAEAV